MLTVTEAEEVIYYYLSHGWEAKRLDADSKTPFTIKLIDLNQERVKFNKSYWRWEAKFFANSMFDPNYTETEPLSYQKKEDLHERDREQGNQ